MNDSVPEPGPSPPEVEAEPEPEPGPEPEPEPEPEYAPAAPAPLNVPRTPTGNAEVDARSTGSPMPTTSPRTGHVEVYEDVHRGLRDALTALDARPGPTRHPTSAPNGALRVTPSQHLNLVQQQELNRTWQEWHAAVSTPSWSAGSSPARGSTPAS